MPRVEEKIYFEVLFWGGGHTLQFQHALLMVVAWLWIAVQPGQFGVGAIRVDLAHFVDSPQPMAVHSNSTGWVCLAPPGGRPNGKSDEGQFAAVLRFRHDHQPENERAPRAPR